MPDVYIDSEATEKAGRAPVELGAPNYGEYWVVPVLIPVGEVSAWLEAYDPPNQYSPNAADSRLLARAVLDELKRATGS